MQRTSLDFIGAHLIVVPGLVLPLRQLEPHSDCGLDAADRRRPEASIWRFMVLSAKSG